MKHAKTLKSFGCELYKSLSVLNLKVPHPLFHTTGFLYTLYNSVSGTQEVRVVTRLSRRCQRHRRQRSGASPPSDLAWMWFGSKRKHICLPLQLASVLRVPHWCLAPVCHVTSAPDTLVSVMLRNFFWKLTCAAELNKHSIVFKLVMVCERINFLSNQTL